MTRLSHVEVEIMSPAPDLSDSIPATLEPILASVLREVVPMIAATLAELKRVYPVPVAKPLRRSLGEISFPMINGTFNRAALPFTLWKAQTLLDDFKSMSTSDRQAVRDWLVARAAGEILDLDIPRLERMALHVRLAPSSHS